MIDFSKLNIPDYEMVLIGKIMQRALNLLAERGAKIAIDPTTHAMDIAACHALGCTLRLHYLLMCDNADFANDYVGIIRNIDRNTGKLLNGFQPRFALDRATQ